MRIWRSSLAIAALLIGCTNKVEQSPSASDAPKQFRAEIYSRGDGRDSIGCTETPDRDVCASREEFGYLFTGCSNDEFECVFNSYNVFAVPKVGLKEGQKYSVFGATLTVERCFGGEKEPCKSAMVSTMCADDAVCSCRLAEIGKTKAIFYYSAELGITVFFATIAERQEIHSESTLDSAELEDAVPLRTYVLTNGSGFLRKRWNLRKAKLTTGCQH